MIRTISIDTVILVHLYYGCDCCITAQTVNYSENDAFLANVVGLAAAGKLSEGTYSKHIYHLLMTQRSLHIRYALFHKYSLR
jgi:hypothetical protein